VFNIPYTTHNRLLHLICDDKPIEVQLLKRSLTFIKNILCNENQNLALCGKLLLDGSSSDVGKNIKYICKVFSINKKDICNINVEHIVKQYCTSIENESDNITASVIKDLLFMRYTNSNVLNPMEIAYIIDNLCTS
jgi:hypothetical protein